MFCSLCTILEPRYFLLSPHSDTSNHRIGRELQDLTYHGANRNTRNDIRPILVKEAGSVRFKGGAEKCYGNPSAAQRLTSISFKLIINQTIFSCHDFCLYLVKVVFHPPKSAVYCEKETKFQFRIQIH